MALFTSTAPATNSHWLGSLGLQLRNVHFVVAAPGSMLAQLDAILARHEDGSTPSVNELSAAMEVMQSLGMQAQDVAKRDDMRRRGQLLEPTGTRTF